MKKIQAEYHPLTSDRWKDFEALFGSRGACGGCWCMWWRIRDTKEFFSSSGAKNRLAMQNIVNTGPPPGILAYLNGTPIGWCSIASRSDFSKLETTAYARPLDDKPVWNVLCFFVAREYQGKGMMGLLLKEAIKHAAAQGAKIIEAYPMEAADTKFKGASGYMGVASTFRKAGFAEECKRGKHLLMRYYLER